MLDPKALLNGTTPGPWYVDPIKEQKIRAPSGRSLLYVQPGTEVVGRGWQKRHTANKRLAAAAPDLARRLVAAERLLRIALKTRSSLYMLSEIWFDQVDALVNDAPPTTKPTRKQLVSR